MTRRTAVLMYLTLAAIGVAGCERRASMTSASLNMDPRADAALRRMSNTLSSARSFKLHSTATIEQRLESGQLAQFSRNSSMVIQRPDRLQAEVRNGGDTYRFWHEGDQLTILNVRQNEYTTIRTPQRLEEMADFLAEQHDLIIPLDDLLYPDVYKALTERIVEGRYVDQQEIAGRLCEHLLFTQENVDWQVWIDAGEPAVPRKIVITYKDDPDQPQFEAVLDQWELNVPQDAQVFRAKLPASARRVASEQMLARE